MRLFPEEVTTKCVRCILGWKQSLQSEPSLSQPEPQTQAHRGPRRLGQSGSDGSVGPPPPPSEGFPEKEVTPAVFVGPALHCPLIQRRFSRSEDVWAPASGHTSSHLLPLAAHSPSPDDVQMQAAALDSWHQQTPKINTVTPSPALCTPHISAVINLRLNFVLLGESSNHWHFNPNKNITKIMLDKSYIIKM